MGRKIVLLFLCISLLSCSVNTFKLTGYNVDYPNGYQVHYSVDDKVGFVNMKEILLLSDAGKNATREFKKAFEKQKTLIQETENELRQCKQNLKNKRSYITKETLKQEEDDYRKKFERYQKLVHDSNAKLEKLDQEFSKKIIPQIVPVVVKIREDENYDYILDINAQETSGYSEEKDLTNRVIKEFNKVYSSSHLARLEEVKNVNPIKFPQKPANLIITASFKDHYGDGVLEGLENGKIAVVIKNTGTGKAHGVKVKLAVLENKKGIHVKEEALLGDIPPGREVKKAIDVSSDKTILPGLTRIKLEAVEAQGFDAEPVIVAFRTSKFKPPKLIVADTGISDFNDNAKVDPHEILDVTVRIQNVGVGKAEDIKAKVIHGGNVFIIPETPQFDLGDLKPGQHKDIKFKFFTNKRIKDGKRIPIDVALSEKRSGLSTKKPLNLIMAKAQKRIREILTEAKEKEAPEIRIAKGLSIDVDMNIPKGRHIAGKDDIAVVIANKNYSRAPRVKFAIHDGRIIKEYLVKTIGFREGNIIYKEDAHLGDFNTIFGKRENPKGKLYNYVEPNSRIFIYYVGHGAPDPGSGSAFFVPVEADPQYIVNSGYSLDTLKENLGKLRVRDITIVLDCCFSGGSAKGEIIKGISPAALQLKDIYAAPGNMTMLLSAKANQVSTWYPEKRHSLFTYYFLKGLQGKADKNKDKRITVAEMKAYLKNNVPRMARRLSNIDQTPVVSGKEDKVLAVLK